MGRAGKGGSVNDRLGRIEASIDGIVRLNVGSDGIEIGSAGRGGSENERLDSIEASIDGTVRLNVGSDGIEIGGAGRGGREKLRKLQRLNQRSFPVPVTAAPPTLRSVPVPSGDTTALATMPA
jgi:hypothetical protein